MQVAVLLLQAGAGENTGATDATDANSVEGGGAGLGRGDASGATGSGFGINSAATAGGGCRHGRCHHRRWRLRQRNIEVERRQRQPLGQHGDRRIVGHHFAARLRQPLEVGGSCGS